MKRISRRAAGACTIALAVFALTGTAFADSGNGNGNGGNSANAPGQQAPAATPAATPAAQPAAQAPGQAKKDTTASSTPQSSNTASPGQAKKDTTASSTPQSSNTASPGQAKQQAKSSSSTPGVKPSHFTTGTKPTSCTTGSTGGTTCAGNGPKADGSKQYGNGKTAAQIAVSRGAPDGTVIKGPGNSQPHKVTVCGKPSNKSGGVDVHAVKSYDASACQTITPACTVNCAPPTPPCGYDVTSQTTVLGGVHTNGKGLAKGRAKHGATVAAKTTYSLVPNGAVCGGTHENVTPGCTENCTPVCTENCSSSGNSAANNESGAVLSANAAPAGSPASASASATPAGGVLGAQATLPSHKAQPRHGVLGAVANISGTSLPFTGFPLWIAVLLAVVLIAGGLMLRGRGRGTATRS